MSHTLDLPRFFQKAPKEWLQRYFAHRKVLANFDWNSVSKLKVDLLVHAWLQLDADLREQMSEDFCNLSLLATPAGKVSIIDEAAFCDKDDHVAQKLAELEDFMACAFWTYLERPQYWDNALFLAASDSKPRRYWRKRIVPPLDRETTGEDGRRLSEAITKLFTEREGRGRYCQIHQIRRGGREYYFAYPQDHRQTSVEYEKDGRQTKRPYTPAFEIIFVHNDKDRTLNIWHQGSGDRVKDLQVAFAQTVLKADIPKVSPKDLQFYELSRFGEKDFSLHLPLSLGIKSIEVRKIRIQVLGPEKYTMRIDLSDGCPRHVLYDKLAEMTQAIPRSMWHVSQVGLKAIFELQPSQNKAKTRSFEVTWPNSCSLQNSGYDLVLQQMLAENGIEPKAGD